MPGDLKIKYLVVMILLSMNTKEMEMNYLLYKALLKL